MTRPVFQPARWIRRPAAARLRGAVVGLGMMVGGGLLGGFASPAAAATPAVLVTDTLEQEPISLVAIGRGRVSYFNADRELRRASLRDLVQLKRIGQPGPTGANETETQDTAATTLIDGQRVVGRWSGTDPQTQAFELVHPAFGPYAVSLDRLVTLTRLGQSPPDASDDGLDRVRLLNGDTLEGFVAGIGPDGGVLLELDGSDAPLPLQPAAVASIRLANPPEAPDHAAATRHLLHFRDGSRLRGRDLEVSADRVAVTLDLPGVDGGGDGGEAVEAVDLALMDLTRIDFATPGLRVLELAAQPRSVASGGRVFELPTPPYVDDLGLNLHAPVVMHVELPPGIVRLAATARLRPDPDPGQAAARDRWADFELILFNSPDEPTRVRLHGRQPEVPINVPIDPALSTLTLELDPGLNGPIFDRLLLEDAVLLQEQAID